MPGWNCSRDKKKERKRERKRSRNLRAAGGALDSTSGFQRPPPHPRGREREERRRVNGVETTCARVRNSPGARVSTGCPGTTWTHSSETQIPPYNFSRVCCPGRSASIEEDRRSPARSDSEGSRESSPLNEREVSHEELTEVRSRSLVIYSLTPKTKRRGVALSSVLRRLLPSGRFHSAKIDHRGIHG